MAISFAWVGRWSAGYVALSLTAIWLLSPAIVRASDEMEVEVSVAIAEEPAEDSRIQEKSDTATAVATVSLDKPTHRQIRTIKPTVDGHVAALKTFVVDPEGRILACVGGLRGTNTNFEGDAPEPDGGVVVMNDLGNTIEFWGMDFAPTAIATAPSGEVFVAGDGKIVKLSGQGETLGTAPLPHIEDEAKMREDAEKKLRDSLKQRSEMFGKQIKTLEDRIAKIEAVDEKDRDRLQDSQLTAFKRQLEMFKSMGLVGDGDISESQIQSAVNRALGVTSMAASDEEVLLTVSPPGGGYSVWRINQDLDRDSAKLVRQGFSGCCGQMDIQCDGKQLIVSENTKFRVAFYDLDGEPISHFGKRDRTSNDGFGSCCNPMNCCPLADGSVLTAESSIGHIKKFDRDGNCIAYIGKASIGGGCKHCSLGFDAEKDLYYMMSEDAGEICVLGNIASHPPTEAETSLARRSETFIKSIAGTWSIPVGKPADEAKSAKKGPIGQTVDSLLEVLGSRSSRGRQSNLPLTKMTISDAGNLSDLEGMYASLGSAAQFRPKFAADTAEDAPVPFGIAMDQAEYLRGTWKTDEAGHATLSFQGFPSIKLVREDSGASTCSTANDEATSIESTTRPDKPASDTVVAVTKDVKSEEAMDLFSQTIPIEAPITVEGTSSSLSAPLTVWEYRVIGPKKLGGRKEMETSLNELGAEGWEYCGMVNSQMMFKRARQSP